MLVQNELSKTLEELKTLQDNYESESSAWIKEKSELQVSLSYKYQRFFFII